MISAKELNALGLVNEKEIMKLALKTVNIALSQDGDRDLLTSEIKALVLEPQKYTAHELWGELAQLIVTLCPNGLGYTPRAEEAPWEQWGDINLDPVALKQMHDACQLPVTLRGALMPDAHAGYGLPIGGVLAVKNAVVPYAVGKDIACRMRLTVLDWPVSALTEHRPQLINALERETSFGVGAEFKREERREHPVMDEDWNFSPVTRQHRERAAKQLGTSGTGNHFAEFGILTLDRDDLGLESGTYLALLSHSGSRGTGEAVAGHYSQLAQSLWPQLPQNLKNLAWLDLDHEAGQEYWAAMELMGRYAAANHELIHRHVLGHLGAQALASVENHHNFAWRENHFGQEMVVHRKGATPAGRGVLGVVPGSMGAPGFVVRGRGEARSLSSCSHGAGRLMSRTAALKAFNHRQVADFLAERQVHLISGGLDEAPMAYKDIHEVMEAQKDLVDMVARFDPRLVKMAPPERRKRR